MWPWGHLAVAYLAYALYTRRRYGRLPHELPVVALAVGSQFPDLLDKPLAWSLAVLPGGRTLGHSLFFAALLVPAAYAVAVRLERPAVGTAFVIGHFSHLAADVRPDALAGGLSEVSYLLWPAVEAPPDSTGSLLEGFLRYSMGTYEWLQLGLLAVAVVVWYRDGMPGAGWVRPAIERYVPASR